MDHAAAIRPAFRSRCGDGEPGRHQLCGPGTDCRGAFAQPAPDRQHGSGQQGAGHQPDDGRCAGRTPAHDRRPDPDAHRCRNEGRRGGARLLAEHQHRAHLLAPCGWRGSPLRRRGQPHVDHRRLLVHRPQAGLPVSVVSDQGDGRRQEPAPGRHRHHHRHPDVERYLRQRRQGGVRPREIQPERRRGRSNTVQAGLCQRRRHHQQPRTR